MADADRATVDQTPDPDEIDRTPVAERGSKMPSMPGTTMDPKKMIGFAAAAGAVMFTVLALGTGLTSNTTLPHSKPRNMTRQPSSPQRSRARQPIPMPPFR
jgi:type IV secretion system protein VirB10